MKYRVDMVTYISSGMLISEVFFDTLKEAGAFYNGEAWIDGTHVGENDSMVYTADSRRPIGVYRIFEDGEERQIPDVMFMYFESMTPLGRS